MHLKIAPIIRRTKKTKRACSCFDKRRPPKENSAVALHYHRFIRHGRHIPVCYVGSTAMSMDKQGQSLSSCILAQYPLHTCALLAILERELCLLTTNCYNANEREAIDTNNAWACPACTNNLNAILILKLFKQCKYLLLQGVHNKRDPP